MANVNANLPAVGQTVNVRGVECTIVKLYPAGTLDARSKAGQTYRVTGLPFTLCGACKSAKPYGQSCICFDNGCQ